MNSSNSYLKYVDLDLEPELSKFVIASYKVKKAASSRLEGLAFLGSVAAEASTGTWIDVATATNEANKVAGKVFSFEPVSGIAKIAFPLDLFELGNVSQLLTVVAGNSFGLADVSSLKLVDLQLPEVYVRSFKGPKFGIPGIYQRLGIKSNTPIIGSIIKPKCGLSAKEHASICYNAWVGMAEESTTDGVDMVKDDEALTSQNSFENDFYTRISLTLDQMKKAEDITGKKKIYVPNITTSNVAEALKRAEFVAACGGDAVMIDFVMGGCTLLHSIRHQDLNLIIHGHRTLFAAMHRAQDFGVDFMVWAKLFRMIGGDQMHTGTPGVGVMSAKKSNVIEICRAVTESSFETQNASDGYLDQSFLGVKGVAPICGAGLDPLTTAEIVNVLGPSIIMFAGGGVHGHPLGTRAGAASMRESVNAVVSGTGLKEWVSFRKSPWLNRAWTFFNNFDKQSPNGAARETL